ncbi:hypothetical protein BJV82DRAFT_616003 [Fennellomyces sp. T-0311]|nr:hypothetical protein BJV82DRAFT_616003 [Fennellomyces sp. T-0311]
MSNLGIRKGTRQFKPQATKRRVARSKDVEQRTESKEQGKRSTSETMQQSRKRTVPDEPSCSPISRTAPVPPKIPFSLVEQTLGEYRGRKRRRPLGLPKEELKKLAQKEAEEEAKEKAKELQQQQLISHTPQVKLVNGEIVLDESSLCIDQYKDPGEREMVEENEYIKMKRGPNNSPRVWTEQETELFFELLGEHGTDFEAISKRIPGRSRDQVQRKYKAEYTHHPYRIYNLFH